MAVWILDYDMAMKRTSAGYIPVPVKASHKTNYMYKTNWELRRLTKRTANCGVTHKTNRSVSQNELEPLSVS